MRSCRLMEAGKLSSPHLLHDIIVLTRSCAVVVDPAARLSIWRLVLVQKTYDVLKLVPELPLGQLPPWVPFGLDRSLTLLLSTGC